MSALVWIQREFRVDYLPALQTALEKHENVIVAYFHDVNHNLGGATKTWLANALENLQQAYQARNGSLWIVDGDFQQEFEQLVKDQNITQIYYSYQVGEGFFEPQQQVLDICSEMKVGLTPFFSEDFFDPSEVKNLKGSPYLVFTPFYKNCMKQIDQVAPLHLTQKNLTKTAMVNVPKRHTRIPPNLVDTGNKKWASKILKYWQVGENSAWQQFDTFLENAIKEYDTDRNFPSVDATSRLSPYLHFGHVTPVSLYFYVQTKIETGELNEQQIQPWIRQLFWRGFARYLLVWFPNKEKTEFNDKYAQLEWQKDDITLNHWQNGLTGIPIVDAGMRELWETGTMHNRVRMLVASLLTKNLNIDWREGLNWFADTLLDADSANNSMGWQWVAGCGVDAAPYYRLFNPVVQSEKFDKQGEYIKKWVPELKPLSSKAVHEPWKHELECQMKGVTLGKDYPHPIVDLKKSREQHLSRVEALKNKAS